MSPQEVPSRKRSRPQTPIDRSLNPPVSTDSGEDPSLLTAEHKRLIRDMCEMETRNSLRNTSPTRNSISGVDPPTKNSNSTGDMMEITPPAGNSDKSIRNISGVDPPTRNEDYSLLHDNQLWSELLNDFSDPFSKSNPRSQRRRLESEYEADVESSGVTKEKNTKESKSKLPDTNGVGGTPRREMSRAGGEEEEVEIVGEVHLRSSDSREPSDPAVGGTPSRGAGRARRGGEVEDVEAAQLPNRLSWEQPIPIVGTPSQGVGRARGVGIARGVQSSNRDSWDHSIPTVGTQMRRTGMIRRIEGIRSAGGVPSSNRDGWEPPTPTVGRLRPGAGRARREEDVEEVYSSSSDSWEPSTPTVGGTSRRGAGRTSRAGRAGRAGRGGRGRGVGNARGVQSSNRYDWDQPNPTVGTPRRGTGGVGRIEGIRSAGGIQLSGRTGWDRATSTVGTPRQGGVGSDEGVRLSDLGQSTPTPTVGTLGRGVVSIGGTLLSRRHGWYHPIPNVDTPTKDRSSIVLTYGEHSQRFETFDVPRDGNCFWAAFAEVYHHDARRWAEIKLQTRNFLTQVLAEPAHPRYSLYLGLSTLAIAGGSGSLLQQLHECNMWTSDEMTQIIADLFDVELIVHFCQAVPRSPGSSPVEGFYIRGPHNRQQVFLSLAENHWKGLRPAGALESDFRWEFHVNDNDIRTPTVLAELQPGLPRALVPRPRLTNVTREDVRWLEDRVVHLIE
ncbi:MAG: hypothetical protein M1813_000537 [Trichoglossum hirsutum]|nr:MAG: hypothetical protein M1813_000537 [Trichoglossum hirsutum]